MYICIECYTATSDVFHQNEFLVTVAVAAVLVCVTVIVPSVCLCH